MIWTAYGFWLPNDARGSWSTEVWTKHLRPFGEATKTDSRRSLARVQHDARLRREAKRHLLYPPVRFDGIQAREIARGFGSILSVIRLHLFACAMMPDHVHLIVDRHAELLSEQIVAFLKRAATRQLNREGIHPLRHCQCADGSIPTPWVVGGWIRYLDNFKAVADAIEYVRENPTKIGLPAQPWWFLTSFTKQRTETWPGGHG